MDKISAPAGLSAAALAHWAEITAEWEEWNPDELARLESALQAWDRWQAARAIIEHEGLQVQNRFGERRAHPLLAVERDNRAAFVAIMRGLGLQMDTPQLSVSEAARRAAMKRWHGRTA